MKTLRPHLILILMLIGAMAMATLIGTGSASAHITDDYASVRQVICTTQGATVDVSYTNEYGNTVNKSGVYLDGDRVGSNNCITIDTSSGEYGDMIWTSVNSDGGYVYCAIYENGTMVSQSEDNSEYYSYASCV